MCDLRGAFLIRAKLSRANFTNVDLALAKFDFADLTDADLAGAELLLAQFESTNLSSATHSRRYLTMGEDGERKWSSGLRIATASYRKQWIIVQPHRYKPR